MGMLLLLNKFRVGMHMGVKRRKKETVQKAVKRVRELFYGTHFILQGGSKTSNSISISSNNNSSNSKKKLLKVVRFCWATCYLCTKKYIFGAKSMV